MSMLIVMASSMGEKLVLVVLSRLEGGFMKREDCYYYFSLFFFCFDLFVIFFSYFLLLLLGVQDIGESLRGFEHRIIVVIGELSPFSFSKENNKNKIHSLSFIMLLS